MQFEAIALRDGIVEHDVITMRLTLLEHEALTRTRTRYGPHARRRQAIYQAKSLSGLVGAQGFEPWTR